VTFVVSETQFSQFRVAGSI